MNTTYKHLDDPIRLAGLSLMQWAQLLACMLAAYATSKLLPLPGEWALSVSITLCGLPAAAAMVAMSADFDVAAYTLAAIRWYRHRTRYLPGTDPDKLPTGYHVHRPVGTDSDSPDRPGAAALALDSLWR